MYFQAQRLGLVEQPKLLLNETEWAVAKNKAQQREDFSQPCVICKEDIGKICHVSRVSLIFHCINSMRQITLCQMYITVSGNNLQLGYKNLGHLKHL